MLCCAALYYTHWGPVGHICVSKLVTLQWRHNERDSVSNHQPHDCLLRRRSKKHQSSASMAFVRGIHRGPVNSPHKWPVTRKMFPFDDVIMQLATIGSDNESVPFQFQAVICNQCWFVINLSHGDQKTFSKQKLGLNMASVKWRPFSSGRNVLRYAYTGIILCISMCPASEKLRYTVTPSLIGWAHTQNDPCTAWPDPCHQDIIYLSGWVSYYTTCPREEITRHDMMGVLDKIR